MAHQPMHINDWIEIDSDYSWYLQEKAKVITEQGMYACQLRKGYNVNTLNTHCTREARSGFIARKRRSLQ